MGPRLTLLSGNSHSPSSTDHNIKSNRLREKIWRGKTDPCCTHSQKEGLPTSQESSTREDIFTANRRGVCVIYPKGPRRGRKVSSDSEQPLQALLSEQPVLRTHASSLPRGTCPAPVGKPLVVQLFLGPEWDSLVGRTGKPIWQHS